MIFNEGDSIIRIKPFLGNLATCKGPYKVEKILRHGIEELCIYLKLSNGQLEKYTLGNYNYHYWKLSMLEIWE